MAKVVIIGIDGGSLKLIKQWKDELPNFREFIDHGVSGDLESTIPPVTSPAWPCMFTGKNPAKIGVYGFLALPSDEKQDFSVYSSLNYSSPSAWRIASDYGKRVGLLNIPMTYPPYEINGFMVSGFGSPFSETRRGDYTYPASLLETLDKVVGGYEIEPLIDLNLRGKERQYIDALTKMLSKREKAAKYLISSFDLDLFICVFAILDRVQHYFWHHMDETHPRHGTAKYKTVVKDFYRKVDCAVGELLNAVPKDTNILITSDHGFQAKHGEFLINKWLEGEGFLYFDTSSDQVRRPIQALRELFLSLSTPGLTRFVSRLVPQKLLSKLLARTGPTGELGSIFGGIDWHRTKAFALPASGSGATIFINLRGRQSKGIVEPGDEYEKVRDDIIARLRKIAPPDITQPFNIQIFKKEDIYHGEHLKSAPDIIFLMDNYGAMKDRKGSSVWRQAALSGMHDMDGVFMAYGPDIEPSGKELPNLKIYDIAPTLLHLSGLPVPEDMDGRVLTEIFKNSSEPARREIAYYGIDHETGRVKDRVKKLKKLGKL